MAQLSMLLSNFQLGIYLNVFLLLCALSITSAVWSYNRESNIIDLILARFLFIGILIVAFSSVQTGKDDLIVSGHIPIIDDIFYILGLSIFLASVFLSAIQTIVTPVKSQSHIVNNRLIRIAQMTSAIMFIGAVSCSIISYISIDSLRKIVPLSYEYYYEMLFWSSFYMLQFVYVQVFMTIVLISLQKLKGSELIYNDSYEMLLCLNLFLSMSVFFGHYQYDIESTTFKDFYSLYMPYLLFIVLSIIMIVTLFDVYHMLFANKSSS